MSGADAIREVLLPVYEALAIDWDPATVGAIEDEIGPVAVGTVRQAVLDEFAARRPLNDGAISPEMTATARALARSQVATE